jgi:NAD+ synthase (glutamine-hydrolysing)
MLLMAYANHYGFFVLGTANKSELALGYGTLYGDLCGALSVLGDLTKERVYALAHWINRKKEVIPRGVIERPPSAELKRDQLDSDSLPPYEIVDRVVEGYVEEGASLSAIAEKMGISLEIVKDLVCKIEKSEYKRRQAPLGLRVTKKAFAMGRRIPIVSQWNK